MSINRRQFLEMMGAVAGDRSLAFAAQRSLRKPNIIFILADDLGYGDLGCYGQKQMATPNLDRLAQEGVRFTQAYAGSTVCAPSRCALMTGLHMGHARIRGNARFPLRPADLTVAELLKGAGYRTGLIGKWGLGEACSTGIPNAKGFDEWLGYLNQQHAHNYFPEFLWENQREVFLAGNMGTRKQYSHDLFTDRALQFLQGHRDQPFFLYLAYTIPHANNELGRETGNGMDVPGDAPYSGKDWPQVERNFAAMVHRLDADVGKVLEQLKKLGLDEDTIVFFSSDNGPHREGGHDPDFFDSNGPLRGIKRDLYEGGIRMPMLVRWPGKIHPGRVSDQAWAFWDFLPTAAELAGLKPPQGIDGISLLPALLGKPQRSHDYLYWEFHERGFTQAVRLGDWKGVRPGRKRAMELYNLAEDLGERNDLAGKHPELAAKIARIMETARFDSPEWPVREA